MADALLSIGIDAKRALQSLNTFKSTTEKQLNGIQSGFNGLRNVAIAAVGVLAGRQLLRGLNTIIAAASQQQDAVNALNESLRSSGEFSEEASKDIQKFASQIQATSVFGDELVLSNFALAKSFGLTNDQAKLATEAAVELAARTGVTLDTAIRQVGGSFNGVSGQLGKLSPEIRGLTKEQLAAGEAAKILIAQFGGSALAQLQTFSGAQKALNNAYGDTLEALGAVIVENKAVISVLNVAKAAFEEVSAFISDNTGTFDELVTKLAEVSEQAIPFLIDAFKTAVVVTSALIDPTLALANGISFTVQKITDALIALVVGIQNRILSVFATIAGGAQKLGKVFGIQFSAIDKVVDSLNKSLDESNSLVDVSRKQLFDFSKAGKDTEKQIKQTSKALDSASGATKELSKQTKILEKSQKDVEAQAKATASEVEKIAQENENLVLSIAKIGKTTQEVAQIDNDYQTAKIEQQIASLDLSNDENKALAEQLTLKKELLSAQNSLSSSGGAASSALPVNADGAVITQEASKNRIGNETATVIKNAFGEGAANFATSLGAFANPVMAVGEAIKGVIGVVDGLIKLGPDILNGIAGIFQGLTNLPMDLMNAFFGLLDSITELAGSLLQNIIKTVPKIIVKAFSFLLKELPSAIRDTLKELPALIKEVLASLPDLLIELAEGFPAIIGEIAESLVTLMPDIALSLVDSLILKGGIFRIAFALAKALSIDMPLAIARGIMRGISNAGARVFGELGNIFSKGITFPKIEIPRPEFLDEIPRLFDQMIQNIKDFFAGLNPFSGGGGGGFIGQVGGFFSDTFGLAEGGTVPQGFPNDNFPARLTSGEEVISMDRARRLDEFMEGERNVVIQINVAENRLADVIYNLNRRGFRTA